MAKVSEKVDPDRWEFANEGFLRGQRHLLRNIHRRKPVSHVQSQPPLAQSSSVGPCVEVGKFGLEGEIARLNRDKNVLMVELVRLRQQQQSTERELQHVTQRLQRTEQRQQQMMSFLAKAVQNPGFLAQLVQQNENGKRMATDRKRRRLPKQEEDVDADAASGSPNESQIVRYHSNPSLDTARTLLYHLMNPDSSTEMEGNNAFDGFFDELDLGIAEDTLDANPYNRNMGLTLTEMPVADCDMMLDGNEMRKEGVVSHEPPSPDTLGGSEVIMDGLVPSLAMNGSPGNSDVKPVLLDPGLSPIVSADGPGNIAETPTLSSGSGINDVFWEQFLGGTADSTSETEETDLVEESIRANDGDSLVSGQGWMGKPNVDMLAQKMEQLSQDRHQ